MVNAVPVLWVGTSRRQTTSRARTWSLSPAMGTVIRAATATDAAAIAGIHVRSWQSAYRGMIDDDILDGLSVAGRTADWTERLRSTRSAITPPNEAMKNTVTCAQKDVSPSRKGECVRL